MTLRAIPLMTLAALVTAGLAWATPGVAWKVKVGRGAGVPAVEATAV